MASDNIFGYIPQIGMDGFVSKIFKIMLLCDLFSVKLDDDKSTRTYWFWLKTKTIIRIINADFCSQTEEPTSKLRLRIIKGKSLMKKDIFGAR